jgi:hypothetical protein
LCGFALRLVSGVMWHVNKGDIRGDAMMGGRWLLCLYRWLEVIEFRVDRWKSLKKQKGS